MKKYLLNDKLNYYKANLHCHTIVSDGQKTPEEVKKIYSDMGYSVVAYTDHDVFIPHDELNDDKFLALHGFEMEINEDLNGRDIRKIKTCHLCFIALKPDNLIQPCYHRSKYMIGNGDSYRKDIKFDETEKDFEREYTAECINEMISTARNKGFFVTYNHPSWSLEDYNDYSKYTGMNAMEMFNGACITMGYEDYNPRVYDDILNLGNKIYAVAGDDNHNFRTGRRFDSGIAFTMINAKSLNYTDITKALEKGDTYCSEKPLIYSLSYEDVGDCVKFYMDFSSANRVFFTTDMRVRGIEYKENSKDLIHAEFSVSKICKWVRFTVVDEQGKKACTNAYFLNDLESD